MHALLTNAPFWGAVLGVVTPLFAAVVQQPQWSTHTRRTVAIALAAAITVVTLLTDGGFDSSSVSIATFASVVAVSQAAYHGLWKPSGLTGVIEQLTTFTLGTVADPEPTFPNEPDAEPAEPVSADDSAVGPAGESPDAPIIDLDATSPATA